jgi:hypothetical protein
MDLLFRRRPQSSLAASRLLQQLQGLYGSWLSLKTVEFSLALPIRGRHSLEHGMHCTGITIHADTVLPTMADSAPDSSILYQSLSLRSGSQHDPRVMSEGMP